MTRAELLEAVSAGEDSHTQFKREIRNPVLVSYVARGLLPYHGLGSGIARVQAMGLKFDLVNDRDGCQFKAVVWRHAATSTAPITATTATTTATTATTTATTTAPADEDVRARILEAVRRTPRITAEAIAEDLGGISVDGVRYHLNALKRLKGLRYEGNPMKGGHWVVP